MQTRSQVVNTGVRCLLDDPTWLVKRDRRCSSHVALGRWSRIKTWQRQVIIRNILPIDDITEQVIRRTADKEAEIGFDV